MRTAVCSGSFDPITLGHLDIIRRTAACFDRVWVCVSPNAAKKNQMFTPEQKLLLVRAAVAELPNVQAELWPGLLADYAAERGADAIVRGAKEKRMTAVHAFDDQNELVRALRADAKPGDALLFKGSRGMRMERALALFMGEEVE